MKLLLGYVIVINIRVIVLGDYLDLENLFNRRDIYDRYPAKREQQFVDFSPDFDTRKSGQWPLSPWDGSERKRRSSDDLVPVDIESFRSQFVDYKPKWIPNGSRNKKKTRHS
uniref:Uncharacterized protein n=1 Tax=Clastoptera arizonana TaxID=38151 RepID=A0A1B6DPX9_9HEMI